MPRKEKTATIAKKFEMASTTRRTKLARVAKMARVDGMAEMTKHPQNG